MFQAYSIRQITNLNEAAIEGLGDVLIDCVEGGASVSFILPMTMAKAKNFWERVALEVKSQNRILLIAENEKGEIVGTAQVILDLPENQPHRADIAKFLVHSKARKLGIGKALLQEAEKFALLHNRNVLVLDTETGSTAEIMYKKNGWIVSGQIPSYALSPEGELRSTTYMYKILEMSEDKNEF